MKNKLKIAHISDTHSYFDQIKIDKMPKADVLCDTGDITFRGEHAVLHRYNDWLGKLLDKGIYKHIVVNFGNHELGWEDQGELAAAVLSNATYLENSGTEIEGFKFWGSPNTPEFFNWAFMYGRGNGHYYWDQIPDNTDVLMTHGPPHGILDYTPKGEHVGCKELLQAVIRVKPQVHLMGHIHYAHGIHCFNGTIFMNSSINSEQYNPTQVPQVIEVEK